jgi:diacylglycerol kinase family enzyme
VVLAWGGDGTVRRCIGVLAGSDVRWASSRRDREPLRDEPRDPEGHRRAVAAGLQGTRRKLDVGRFGKERFAVMAGAGFDAAMIRDADALKERIGRAAYVWSGSRHLREEAFDAEIEVDGTDWFEGRATLHPAGQPGRRLRGVEVFPDARPDDGMLGARRRHGEGLCSGRARSRARRWAIRPNRRSCAARRRAR